MTCTTLRSLFVCLAVSVLTLAGCGAYSMDSMPMAGSGGGFGATQGGVQDMGLVRELIAEGKVPPAEAFTVEGMFSEHDLPLEGTPCALTLCLRAAAAVAPTLNGTRAGWLQVGMSSTIDPDTFQRPSQTLVATVDISGSMGFGYGEGQVTPGAIAVKLLHELVDRLDAGDHLAIVVYGSTSRVHLPFVAGDDKETLRASIDALENGGVTDMESGMRLAYDVAREADFGTDETRLLLFTDLQPNVGMTGASEFTTLAEAGAADGIGLTVLGLGFGLGPEIMETMTTVRGGNGFSMTHTDQVQPFYEDNWPWFVSPIAHDLSVTMEVTGGMTVAEAYGFPGTEQVEVSMDVASVFLSKRRGALLVRFAAEATDFTAVHAEGRITYVTPGGTEVDEQLSVDYDASPLDARGHGYEQAIVGRTVALAVLVSNMKAAATVYEQEQGEAVAIMEGVVARVAADAEAMDDEALAPEVQLARDLLALMKEGAPQGTMYPY